MSPPPPGRPVTDYAGYLFDADGTLWHGRRVIDGALALVSELKRLGRHVAIVSNNSVLSVESFYARVRELGLPFERHEVVSAPLAAARYIARQRPGARVHTLGSDDLREQLLGCGLRLEGEPGEVDVLVIGLDRQIDYAKLTRALLVVRAGAQIVALNTDRVSVDEHGLYPGAGMLVGAVRGMTGREPDVVIGKPSPHLLLDAAGAVGVAPGDCLFVGDFLDTDILAANRAGMPALMVLTGVSQVADLSQSTARPDYILPGVAALLDSFQSKE